MKNLTTTIAISFLATLFAFAQTKEKTITSTVVIVPGSWSSASDLSSLA